MMKPDIFEEVLKQAFKRGNILDIILSSLLIFKYKLIGNKVHMGFNLWNPIVWMFITIGLIVNSIRLGPKKSILQMEKYSTKWYLTCYRVFSDSDDTNKVE